LRTWLTVKTERDRKQDQMRGDGGGETCEDDGHWRAVRRLRRQMARFKGNDSAKKPRGRVTRAASGNSSTRALS
jgi:hypothetical protein